MIYHITHRAEWESSRKTGQYEAPSLLTEGFIHCSHRDQVDGVLRRFYDGQPDLVLLAIDPSRLRAEVRYEEAADGAGIFPHVYGRINADAVLEVHPL